ncbi:Alpha-tubulin N-acetyltransferase 1 [Bagarius yarrelli]|uniref:Alpha-tubulin N-acetyltransferase 1 n=1 Tax=Bagarius yarrelli TaxID=175774 RepID=A0A556TNZ2_BAGYA|nr:Alpha-tubulin N-acetyltransferase 1 [Bagarius yarrelli]
MDFPFDLNSLFPERISVLDHNLCVSRKPHGRPEAQNQTAAVIDELGKASAKAQKLPVPITSAAKLQANRHCLYLLKDGERNGGRGAAVGYLKVGYKKLFLLDQRGAHVETEPLCVLDFYVTESLQRHGYGLELFHFMLKHKKVEPEQMAYDRPSSKFLAFLEKHFDLKHSVPQVNNFVVFEGFFRNRSVAQLRKAPPKKLEGEIKPYSLMEREAVREEQKALPWPFTRSTAVPQSPLLAASSPFSRSLSVGSSPNHTPHPQPQPHIPPHLADNCRTKRTSSQVLVTGNNLYSRHVNGRCIGLLTAQQLKLPELKPVLGREVCDTRAQADVLGLQNTEERTHLQGSSVILPPVPDILRQQASNQTALNDVSVKNKGRATEMERGGWSSWTVGEKRFTAQWIRQKHELRSTRPW